MDENISMLIEKSRRYYDGVGRVWCHSLNSFVHFGSEGARHMIYKGNRKKRPVREQKYKMALLKPAVAVLKSRKSTIQSWRLNDDSSLTHIAVIDPFPDKYTGKGQLRVIVKRTHDGQFNYHSVMVHK